MAAVSSVAFIRFTFNEDTNYYMIISLYTLNLQSGYKWFVSNIKILCCQPWPSLRQTSLWSPWERRFVLHHLLQHCPHSFVPFPISSWQWDLIPSSLIPHVIKSPFWSQNIVIIASLPEMEFKDTWVSLLSWRFVKQFQTKHLRIICCFDLFLFD